MARSCADVGEAELLQKRPDIALVEVDVEPLGDDALKIDTPPASFSRSGPASTICANSATRSAESRGFGEIEEHDVTLQHIRYKLAHLIGIDKSFPDTRLADEKLHAIPMPCQTSHNPWLDGSCAHC